MENFALLRKRRKSFSKLSVALDGLRRIQQNERDLKKPLHLDGDPLAGVDYILGAYDPSSHFTDDMYNNKIAYITILTSHSTI